MAVVGMAREVVELVSTDTSNERIHVAPKIAAEEDSEVKECTDEDSLSDNHKSPNVTTEVLYIIIYVCWYIIYECGFESFDPFLFIYCISS